MSGHDSNRADLVAATANRLRMVQVDFADADEAVRAEYLHEQIERALAKLLPDQRQGFLAALMDQFPRWDASAPPPPVPQAPAAPAALSAEDLLSRLIDAAAEMDEGRRAALAGRLRQAGLAGGRSDAAPGGDDEALRRAMRLAPDAPVHLDRAAALAAALVEFAAQLDQLAWGAWRTIRPNAEIRRREPLRETVARMVTGDADASAGVKEALATLGVLVGAMIHGIPQAGLVAERRMETFAPKTIESIIGPGPIWVNKETRMWNKYVELWQAAEGGRLRHEILSAIAQHVEALMNNR
ncbi:MAG: hypothetical protein GX591_02580 [Planctomycetes bacterium]|nr:hypothetical protein [Planctomycetota bacterium]